MQERSWDEAKELSEIPKPKSSFILKIEAPYWRLFICSANMYWEPASPTRYWLCNVTNGSVLSEGNKICWVSFI